MFTGGEDGGEGPRVLLTPELNLDNTYQLSFDWMAASKAAIDEGKYDFQVRIVTDGNVEGAETIWSFNNATQLKENGNVPYPWTAWTPYKTMIDLSKWQGKSIRWRCLQDAQGHCQRARHRQRDGEAVHACHRP